MQRDRASGYAFLRIATACREHGRDDLALRWAQRGRDSFPTESRLIELIGDVHADNGRHDDALAADRELFTGGPSLERYRRLKDRAETPPRMAGRVRPLGHARPDLHMDPASRDVLRRRELIRR